MDLTKSIIRFIPASNVNDKLLFLTNTSINAQGFSIPLKWIGIFVVPSNLSVIKPNMYFIISGLLIGFSSNWPEIEIIEYLHSFLFKTSLLLILFAIGT